MGALKNRFKLMSAVYLLLRRHNEILLLKRTNTGFQDGNYSIIAGHLDGDELATHAMAREAEEEAGIIVDPKDLNLIHVIHRLNRGEPGQEHMDLFFETSRWQGEIINKEPEKCTELSWYSLDQLPNNITPFIKQVIVGSSGKNYSEYPDMPR